MSIFELKDVCYNYEDGKEVLKNINYTFEKSKVYAITGRSGTGKTTLLSLMSGLDKVKSGKIIYNGEDISKIDEDLYRSQHVGVIFQSFNLLPHLTAAENVELSMDIAKLKISKEEKKKKVLEVLDSVGLSEEKANKRILRLSGGEQQRVAIARTLAYNPNVILADEPTGNLDLYNEEQIIEIFKKLAHEKNKCVIIVTHSKTVASSADEVFDLQKAKNK